MTERNEIFARWNAQIPSQDAEAMRRAKAHWDGIAKPLCGLGKLETAIVRIAGCTGDEHVSIEPRAIAVLCADNGIVKEGVTQTDASVTAVMAGRIKEHRSSVCLMAKTARADVFAVDLGKTDTLGRGIHALEVLKRTEELNVALFGAVSLKTLEHLGAIVEYGAGGMQGDGTEGNNAGIMPAVFAVVVH